MNKQTLKQIGLLLLAVLFVFLAGWRCPIRTLTGWPCPGCGMSRALLAFLKGDFALSLHYHPMLVPTGIAALLFICMPKKRTPILMIWCALMILCYIWRMAVIFPEPPMDKVPGLLETIHGKGII